MNTQGFQRVLYLISSFILLGLFIFLLYWRFQVSQMRFFDVDEFTHMNWTASIARGEKPYIDFFTIFSPVYHTLMSLIFKVNGKDPSVFIQARLISYGIFLIMMGLIAGLFYQIRKGKLIRVLLPLIFFAWLPMPYDKILEIRPDNLAVILGLAGIFFQVYAMLHESKRQYLYFALSGAAYAACLAVLVKFLPFAGIAYLVMMLEPASLPFIKRLLKKKISKTDLQIPIVSFSMGFGIVSIIFLLWLLSYGNFSLVWYSLTKLAVESNVAEVYIMEPHLFFFPNSSFYGLGGANTSFILNHTVWVLGLVMATFRLFTPFVTAKGDRKKALTEILTAGICIVLCVLYVKYYPRKHSQYLIPISVFIVIYAADFIISFFSKIRFLPLKYTLMLASIIIGSILFINSTIEVNAIKLTWNNTQQLTETKKLLDIIPQDAKVFDLEGRTVFWKPAYYICCLPFGSYIHALSRKPESLITVLQREKPPYIFQGLTGRLPLLTQEELSFIGKTYEPVPGWDQQLFKIRQ